jgi:hypothetical protein
MITQIIFVLIAIILLWVIWYLYDTLNNAREYIDELRLSLDWIEELLRLHNNKGNALYPDWLSTSTWLWTSTPNYEIEIEGKKRTLDFSIGSNIPAQVEKIKCDIELEKKIVASATDIANEAINKREKQKKYYSDLYSAYAYVTDKVDSLTKNPQTKKKKA